MSGFSNSSMFSSAWVSASKLATNLFVHSSSKSSACASASALWRCTSANSCSRDCSASSTMVDLSLRVSSASDTDSNSSSAKEYVCTSALAAACSVVSRRLSSPSMVCSLSFPESSCISLQFSSTGCTNSTFTLSVISPA